MQLEIEVWRVACRTPRLQDALDALAPLLREQLGVRALLLRLLEPPRDSRLTTEAATGSARELPGRTSLPAGGYHALAAWIGARRPLVLPDPDAAELSELLLPQGLRPPAVVLPLAGTHEPLGAAVFSGVRLDPSRLQPLAEPLATALELHVRQRELRRLHESAEADRQALLSRLNRSDISEAIVGSQGGLREVLRRVDQVASTEAPVLLLGETGSGKEVIARAVHARSRRSRGPVVKVNCGAIPPGLLDSELFGHERGSFTGAEARRRGWFEQADGGTLFLDEVAELPLAAQVRLLRVLQDGTLFRVGGQAPIQVDVRVVAATHRDLEQMVAQGRFREDLWYRIGVFPIALPPLRERGEDIPELAAHFAWRAGKRLGGLPLAPSPEDVELLLRYPWPGNVRELAAVIERAAILGGGHGLDLAAALGRPVPTQAHSAPAEDEEVLPLDQVQVRGIEAALRKTHGRIEGPGGAAELLEINPHTLRSRMRKLGVEWGRFR